MPSEAAEYVFPQGIEGAEACSSEGRIGMAVDPWFALRVKSNFEQTSARLLRCQGYEEFVPTYSARRQWTDRTKIVEVPLFPGYIFCRLNRWTLAPVIKTPGIV